MTITALPAAPSRSDTPANFITKADAFVAALAVLVTEMNLAIASANQTKWITGTTYAIGDEVWSPADFQAYRAKTAGVSVTDPSADSTNWQRTEVSETSLQNQTYTAYLTGGSSTAYTLTPTPAVAALAENQEFDVEFHTAAGATPTLAISGLTAKLLKYRDSAGAKQAVTSSQIPSGWRSRVVYDGTDYIVREIASTVPSGSGMDWWGANLPGGYLWADGAAVSRTTYAGLFAAIGTTHGVGDGSTTFNVPDKRGRVSAGKDDMGGSAASRLTTAGSTVDGATLGASGGDQLMQAHTHTTNHNGSLTSAGSGGAGQQAGVTGSTGGGNSENVQPTIVCNYIIKT